MDFDKFVFLYGAIRVFTTNTLIKLQTYIETRLFRLFSTTIKFVFGIAQTLMLKTVILH